MDQLLNGELAIIGTRGCGDFVRQVADYLRDMRSLDSGDSLIYKADCPRYGTGESKGELHDSMRGHDLYIICDCFNYNETYKMFGITDHAMSPDDHFADLKRIIAANRSEARRVSVIMPMLYEGRQHRRETRESLDCAVALQELVSLGVSNIITFDAHDPRVANAIPLAGFDNVMPPYQMLKALCRTYPDISLGKDDLMIVSPDAGAMSRCVYYATVLEVELGMFYKRRDYTKVVNGKNPVIAHEYLGKDIGGKDVIVVDDMISSGESIITVSRKLKENGARRIFIFETFGLFVDGLEAFDKAYNEDHLFTKIFTTNLNYRPKALIDRPWYEEVNMCKYVAYIIDALNDDEPIRSRLDPFDRIKKLMAEQAKRAATQLSFTE